MDFHIERIISGGQTGADRAALDWAIKENIQHGGWCPKGRLAEDGFIPSVYNLSETPSEDYALRTEWNVRDSDATAIFSKNEVLSGGTELTKKLAFKYRRPTIHVHVGLGIEDAAILIKKFVHQYSTKVLNVAGPRASEEPDIGTFITKVLDAAFSQTI
ncbi:putative molybdenum carrier protein [Methylomonas sp. MgM2]